jgi:hypothetical protein
VEQRVKLVVAHPERRAQRTLQRLVGAALCPVEVVADLDALDAAVDADTIAIVDVALAKQRPEIRSRPARAWIAVPGEGVAPAEAEIVDALLAAGWTHVVAQPMPLLAEELLATVQKLLRGDVFGLEKYVTWAAEIRSFVLADALDRNAAVAAVAKDVVAVGLPERAGSMISVIADELLANAIYIAPVDEAGQRSHARAPRDEPRALTGRDAVAVRWAIDARYLAIEVRDRWGSFDLSTLPDHLARGAQRAAEGEGGMGLPLVYACSNQLVIGMAPGELTEVIAMLDVRYKPTELGRSASFHTFLGRPPGGAP